MTAALGSRLLAEAVGTLLLVGIGTGAIVGGARVGGVPQAALAVAWFLAVAVPILLFARRSGAHLNPAVTLALVAARRFPPTEGVLYGGAQVLGAFGGSLIVLATLGGEAHLGATLPAGGDLLRTGLLESVFTILLVLSVFYLTAPSKEPSRLELLLPPTVVGVSTLLIGPFTGSSLNPARTLAPALLSGDGSGLWVYLLVVPAAALLATAMLRVTRKDRSGAVETERKAPPGRA